jgi:predicted RNase H-like HicB family nuclease
METQAMKTYVINVRWDDEAKVWWCSSDDIVGLVTEAATFPELIERVKAIAPELLELNATETDDQPASLLFNSLHIEPFQARVH